MNGPSEFNGSDYDSDRDRGRLQAQMDRVKQLMSDENWRTLSAIAKITGDPPASVSAQLRHLRKPRFGSYTVDKRYLGSGLFEYRVSGGR